MQDWRCNEGGSYSVVEGRGGLGQQKLQGQIQKEEILQMHLKLASLKS